MGFFNKTKPEEQKKENQTLGIEKNNVNINNDDGAMIVAKNEVETEKKTAKNEGTMPILVQIIDVWGTSAKEQTSFGVEKLVEGSNVYLYNKNRNFKEPMPEDTDDYKKYKLDEVKRELEKLDNKLRAARQEKKEADALDLEQQIRIYKGYERSLTLQGRGSYLHFSEDRFGGKPLFKFVRKGMFRLPVFFNTDIDTLYIPSEAKIKTGAQLLKENEEKNGNHDNTLKIINIILTIIIALIFLASLYFSYKASVIPAETANVLVNVTENLNDISRNLMWHTDILLNVSNSSGVPIPTPPVGETVIVK